MSNKNSKKVSNEETSKIDDVVNTEEVVDKKDSSMEKAPTSSDCENTKVEENASTESVEDNKTEEVNTKNEDITSKESKKEKPVKIKKTKKKSKASVILYILSLVFMGYTVFTAYDSYTYVSSLITSGSIDVESQINEIIMYYASTCAPYFFYAMVAWALGVITNKVQGIVSTLENTKR